jgi:hypothetical protein
MPEFTGGLALAWYIRPVEAWIAVHRTETLLEAHQLARQEHKRNACVGYPEPQEPARYCDWCGVTHFPTVPDRGPDPEAWEAEVP